jgi:cation diffusion facilitator CzcD-associated flavoprotein CzcO
MKTIQNLIIGAGPAGLATAGRMRHANVKFEIIEKSQNVGNAWRNHYDRLHLHTVKQWSHLPFVPFPDDYPTYVSRRQFVDYIDKYAAHFNINPQYGVEINSIKKEGNYWEAISNKQEKYLAENIIIATGLNSAPKMPAWKGQDLFKGKIIHSNIYKNAQLFIGQKILVVGIGNTGAEIALDLSEHGVDVCVVSRSEITLVPRDLNGRPVQVTAKLLEKFPFGFGDWLGSQIRKFYFGDLSKYGLKISKEHPAKMLRETGKTPLIDIGTIAAIKSGKIKVVGDIDHFTETGVQFINNGHIDFDQVILATGYRARIEEFIERGGELLDTYGCPKSPIGEGFHKGLYFVGFDNYKLGGIVGTIYNDSERVVDAIKKIEVKN